MGAHKDHALTTAFHHHRAAADARARVLVSVHNRLAVLLASAEGWGDVDIDGHARRMIGMSMQDIELTLAGTKYESALDYGDQC